MRRMRRGYFFFFKLLLALALLGFLLKAITFLPSKILPSFLADGVVFLQSAERGVENWFADFAETLRLTASKRERERRYEILYRQRSAETVMAQALVHENNRLRAALYFQRGYAGGLIPAEVVGRSADHWHRFVT
ncbi:rod shape-determining protein MreC, partial [Candidatus Termititenax persephonae]